MSKKTKKILHRRTIKKINIALCVVTAALVVAIMFLLMKRKEAIMQTENQMQIYETAKDNYSYEGLLKQQQELQQKIDDINSDISDRNEEINDFNEMISKAKSRENSAIKFNELAETYKKLLESGK